MNDLRKRWLADDRRVGIILRTAASTGCVPTSFAPSRLQTPLGERGVTASSSLCASAVAVAIESMTGTVHACRVGTSEATPPCNRNHPHRFRRRCRRHSGAAIRQATD